MAVIKYRASDGSIKTVPFIGQGQAGPAGPTGPEGPAGPAGPAGNINMKHATASFDLDSGPSVIFYLVKIDGNSVSANDYFITSSCGGVNQPVMCTPWTSPDGYIGFVTSNFWRPTSGVINVTVHVAIGRYDGSAIGAVTLEQYIY